MHMQVHAASNFDARLKLYAIDETTCARLRELWPIVGPSLADAIDKFIEMEKLMPPVAKVFEVHGPFIRDLELNHWRLLLSGRLDQKYVESCKHVSEQGNRLGLNPRTRIFSGNLILEAAADAIARRFPFSARKAAAYTKILAKVISFDITTAATFYQDAASDAAEARRQKIQSAISELELASRDTIEAVKSVLAGLANGATEMRDVADETTIRTKSAVDASAATKAIVEVNAPATEQLSQSIIKIGHQSEEGIAIAQSTGRDVEVAVTRLDELSAAVTQIGSIVDIIANVAGQTNLLALNATIEAARAGDAGKGFAVVAAEVKTLASETGKATDGISRQINSIRHAAQALAEQFGAVAQAVQQISSRAAEIEESVQKQTVATKEIAVALHTAMANSDRTTQDVEAIQSSTSRSMTIVKDVGELTERLSSRAADLEAKLSQFFAFVQAA
jgi:methyl-accepting chemotaxis protein